MPPSVQVVDDTSALAHQCRCGWGGAIPLPSVGRPVAVARSITPSLDIGFGDKPAPGRLVRRQAEHITARPPGRNPGATAPRAVTSGKNRLRGSVTNVLSYLLSRITGECANPTTKPASILFGIERRNPMHRRGVKPLRSTFGGRRRPVATRRWASRTRAERAQSVPDRPATG